MSYSNDGNYQNRPFFQRQRVNMREVPSSRHALFIRGLPGSVTADEVKEFFEDRVGPCTLDFCRVSACRSRLFVAVRFETTEEAEECMDKFNDAQILGFRCELSWFKDVSRFANYQASQTPQPRGNNYQARGQQNYTRTNSYTRPHKDSDRKRRRSHSSSRSASSRSRSRSESSRDSRSPSRSSRRSRSDRRRREDTASPHSSPDREHRKKEKKEKKRKSKKHHKRSVSRSGSESAAERRGSRLSRRSRSNTPERTEDIPPPPPPPEPILPESSKLIIQVKPKSALQNTSFSFGLDGDESPKRIVRKLHSPEIRAVPVSPVEDEKSLQLPPPPMPPKVLQNGNERGSKFKPIAPPTPPEREREVKQPPRVFPPPPPPVQTEKVPRRAPSPSESSLPTKRRSLMAETPSIRKTEARSPSPVIAENRSGRSSQNAPSPRLKKEPSMDRKVNTSSPLVQEVKSRNSVNENDASPSAHPPVDSTQKNKKAKKAAVYPMTAKVFRRHEMRSFQKSLLATVRAPKPKYEDEDGMQLSLSLMEDHTHIYQDDMEREAALKGLDKDQLELAEVKMGVFAKKFKADAETFSFVVKKLLEKNPKVEPQLRESLMEVMEDLERQMYEKFEKYLHGLREVISDSE